MDRSIDSIGSCSLDADSTDFSDTSESLNFISPSATHQDFTAGIAERVRKIQTTQPLTPKLILNQSVNQRTATTAYFDINSGKFSTIVSRTSGETNGGCYFNGNTEKFLSTKTIELQSPTVVAHANKKPSYLNLACCVNGYSNYTNYDSIERKEINKSREVSPIRPIITMARQQRSNDNLLSVPTPVTFIKQSPLTSITKRFASLNINDKDTTDNAGIVNSNGSMSNKKSFIQQRVEKLYGTSTSNKILTTTSTTTTTTVKNSEIHLNGNGTMHVNGSSTLTTTKEMDEKENDEELYMNSLPVMKMLRPEFCRQLQFLNSPKKIRSNIINNNNNNINTNTTIPIQANSCEVKSENLNSETSSKLNTHSANLNKLIEEDIESDKNEIVMENVISKVVEAQEKSENFVDLSNNNNNNCINNKTMEIEKNSSDSEEVRDGHYFLRLLYNEKARILKLADETEKELNIIQSDPATIPTEDVIGLILSAIGKSRLLATKKFKQFEGLCEENLKPSSDGPQTLCGDLQGFWDMMMLQVENIDAAFEDLRKCRENGWVKPQPPSPQAPKGTRLTKRPLKQSQNEKNKSNSTAAAKKTSTAPTISEAAQKREEQRKKILEMKKKYKAAMQENENGSSENNVVEAVNGDSKKQNENGHEIIL